MRFCNPPRTARPRVALTFDLDWAPDFAIRSLLDLLGDLKATVFCTHTTPLLARIRSEFPRIELGFHPNFLPGSTQGGDEEEVLRYGRGLLGRYEGVRAHCLLSSSRLYELYAKRGVRHDSSLIMQKIPSLLPYLDRSGILRIPIFWEDDANALAGAVWNDLDRLLRMPGLKVFNFHPLYLSLNIRDLSNYERFKRGVLKGGRPLAGVSEAEIARYRDNGAGACLDFFKTLLAKIRGGRAKAYTLGELRDAWGAGKD